MLIDVLKMICKLFLLEDEAVSRSAWTALQGICQSKALEASWAGKGAGGSHPTDEPWEAAHGLPRGRDEAVHGHP